MYLESILYHSLPATGTIQVSDVGPTGPWTDLTLTGPTPLIDAIEQWRAAAQGSTLGTYTWSVDATQVPGVIHFSGSGHWVKLTPCQRSLFGFDATPTPPETGYVQGNGSGWIRIPDALGAFSGAYSVITKYERMPTSYASWPGLTTLSNAYAASSTSLPNVTDYLHIQATGPQYRFRGLTLSATQNYASTGAGGVSNGAQVHSISRTGIGTGSRSARGRVVLQNGTIQYSANVTPSVDTYPTDIHLLAFAQADNTLVTPPAPSDARLVAVVVLHREPTDSELQSYAHVNSRDASLIWGSDIKGYWTATDISGSSWPARVGTATGVLMAGLTSSAFTQTYNPAVLAAGASSTSAPEGLLVAPGVARTQPITVGNTSLNEYRGGRASSYTYGRTKEIQLELYLPADESEHLTSTPLGSGHGAFRVTVEDEEADYSLADLDGRIVGYPYTTPEISADESEGDWARVVIRATMEDPQ